MRVVSLLLSLLCLCALSQGIRAAEYQPNTQEWYELITMGENAQENYGRLVTQAKERLDETKKRLEAAKTTILAPDRSLQQTADHLETLFVQIEETDVELDRLLAEVKAIKPEDRTRELYLRYLRPIKHAAAGYPQLQRQLWGPNIPGSIKMGDFNTGKPLPAGPLPTGLTLTLRDFPIIDGSSTTQPLSSLIACRFLGIQAQWRVRQIYSTNGEDSAERILVPRTGETKEPVAQPGIIIRSTNDLGLRLTMMHSNTGSAYRNLAEGAADLILVARPPSPDELAFAKEKKAEYELRTIGYDAFIFMLNKANPVDSLTVKQIQDIYTDNIINWSEVGGEQKRIIAFQRERNSGSQETMESQVMKGLQMAPALEMVIGQGMGGPYNRMHGQENGIAYTFYYYHFVQSPESPALLGQGKPGMKVCKVNGVMPSPETISNHTYPFVTEVLAVVRKGTPKESSAVSLRDWLLTPEGQAVVKDSGYVPLTE